MSDTNVCTIHAVHCLGWPAISEARYAEIRKRCFYDSEGQIGPRGVMYIDGKPISEPTEVEWRSK